MVLTPIIRKKKPNTTHIFSWVSRGLSTANDRSEKSGSGCAGRCGLEVPGLQVCSVAAQGCVFQYHVKELESEQALKVFYPLEASLPTVVPQTKLSCQQITDWRFSDRELQICMAPLYRNQSKDKLNLGKRLYALCACARRQLIWYKAFQYWSCWVWGTWYFSTYCLASSATMKNYNDWEPLVQLHAVHLLLITEFNPSGNAEVDYEGWTVSYLCLSSFMPVKGLCLKSVTTCPLPCLIVINVWKQNPAQLVIIPSLC